MKERETEGDKYKEGNKFRNEERMKDFEYLMRSNINLISLIKIDDPHLFQ